jgi:DNA-binding FadR family transcriptional regulator
MTHNPLHLIMLDSIKDILLEIRREAWALRDEARKAHALHGVVLEAVAAQDVPAAREAMQRHLEQGIRVWRRLGKAVHRPGSTPVSST